MSSVKQQVLSSPMARVFGVGSLLGGGAQAAAEGPGLARQDSTNTPDGGKDNSKHDDVVKRGCLKKYKNRKSRYFVLRCQECSPCPATLSCYDSESKYLDDLPPKRRYLLNQNIRVEPKSDSKRAFAFSIHIKNETLNLVAANAEEMSDWIRVLQSIANTSDWEHNWLVEVQNRGLGANNCGVAAGHAHLCLTKRSLSIVPLDDRMPKTDIALNTIRMEAFNNKFFYLEMGRMASTGSGRLWLTAQDVNIASNIYSVVGRVMTDLSITMGMVPPSTSASSTPRDRTSSMSVTQAPASMSRDRSGSLPCRPNTVVRPPGQVCGGRHPCGLTCTPAFVCGHSATYGNFCSCSTLGAPVTTEAHSTSRQHHCFFHSIHSMDDARGSQGAPVDGGCGHLSTHHETPDTYVVMDASDFEAPPLQSSMDSISSPRGDVSNQSSHPQIPEDDYIDMTKGLSPLGGDNSRWPSTVQREGHHSCAGSCPLRGDHHHHVHLPHHHSGDPQHHQHFNYHHYNNAAAIQAALRASQTPVSPSGEPNEGPYLNMSRTKPISTSALEETSPGSASSSYTSGGGTPSSDHRQEHSSSCSLHHNQQEKHVLQRYQELAAAGGACMTASNLSMETDSVPDVEESVDDILDGASLEDERSARLRLDSLDHCGDDLDMDMEDQDQVDSSVPPLSIPPLDLASVRSLCTPTLSTIPMSVPGTSTRLSSGCSQPFSSSVPAPHALPHQLHHSLPHHQEDDYVLGIEKPIRTSSVGSKPEFVRRKNSTPMLGVSCASRSWSDSSGSYFRNLFSSRSQDKQKDSFLLVDFSKNNSSDQIANSEENKDKKSLSIERIKNTFGKNRSSTKVKKRVSEGDAHAPGSGSFRGGGIAIPVSHSDYFTLEFNQSPRSNNSNHSNTSTNSDVPVSGHLRKRPGTSVSFSSTGSTDYINMNTTTSCTATNPGPTSVDSGYLQMTSPRIPLYAAPPPGGPPDEYVDMTQGNGGLSVSADSSSSGSFNLNKTRKVSNSFSHMSSVELPSPQQEHLHEFDCKSSQKEKKKIRRRSGKESSKRKKSDPSTGEILAETLRNRGSSHFAPFSSFSSFLSRKNSQSSSMKTPLSPTGSPLPKSSRNSSSPFPSLGRSKSKDARDASNPSVSQSPSACVTNPPGTLSFLPCMPPINCQSSPNNVEGCMHWTMMNPSFVDCDSMENENYWTADTPISSAGGSASTLDPSNKEFEGICACCDVKAINRSSGAFDLPSNCEYCGDSHFPLSNLQCCAHYHSSLCGAENYPLKERGTSSPDPNTVYVNFTLDGDRSNSSSTGISVRSNSYNCLCDRHPCSRLVPSEKLLKIDNSLLSLKNVKSQSELGRLSESSKEDLKFSPGVSASQEVTDTSYINMCPPSNERKSIIFPSHYAKTASEKPAAVAPVEERKILNTDPMSCSSLVSSTSDYLEMDMRKIERPSTSSNNCFCSSASSADSLSSEYREPNISSSTSTVVKRPALPQALVGMRTEPSVPLEQLTLTDSTNSRVAEKSFNPNKKASCISKLTPLHRSGAVSIPSTIADEEANCSGSFTERFRSHSGPGAPESRNGKSSVCVDASEETARRGSEGEARALSACSSPMSYSPPTSPNLTSSSKSSLSEGGMSSASSTCTVVNVGLRLQQQQQYANRKSHGSGSSTSTNTDSCSGAAPSPLSSSIINVPSVSLSKTKTSSEQCGGGSTSRQLPCLPQSEGIISQRPKENVVYACLDLAPPKTDVIHSNENSQSPRQNSCQALSSSGVSSDYSSTSSLCESITTTTTTTSGRSLCDPTKSATSTSKLTPTNKITPSTADAAAGLNYAEIDFKKSEGLRTACLAARDSLRH